MQKRGLSLLNHYLNFDQLISLEDFNIPVQYSNKTDGNVPNVINEIDSVLKDADALVFSASESIGHYSGGFKNMIDWLVVKDYWNNGLGSKYSFTDKPIYVFTFTPSKKTAKIPGGKRHHGLIVELLQDKMGGDVRKCFSINNCWEELIPGNYNIVKEESEYILNDLNKYNFNKETKIKEYGNPNDWLNAYNNWNECWKGIE